MIITKAYDEVIDFIAAGSNPRSLCEFIPSEETKERVANLVERAKMGLLSSEENSELSHYLQIEHLMRLAKARARQHLAAE